MKVKGRATIAEVEHGKSNAKDKTGNDVPDKFADLGVQSVNGIGLARLGIGSPNDMTTISISSPESTG